MKKFIKRILPKYLVVFLNDFRATFNNKKSYSQSGEDLIVQYILKNVKNKCDDISYLDIGANHPILLSNTYLFYKNNVNSYGVLVEPNSSLIPSIKRLRPKDTVLNVGVSPDGNEGLMKFYMSESHVLSTFSEEEKISYEKMGHEIVDEIDVKVVEINKLVEKYFNGRSLDVLSLDVEGLDLQILKQFDFNKKRPKIIIVETIIHRPLLEQSKNDDIISHLLSKDYFIYADTYINTIFVDKYFWVKGEI